MDINQSRSTEGRRPPRSRPLVERDRRRSIDRSRTLVVLRAVVTATTRVDALLARVDIVAAKCEDRRGRGVPTRRVVERGFQDDGRALRVSETKDVECTYARSKARVGRRGDAMNGCLSSVTNFSTRHGYASQSITQTPLKNLIHTERIKAYILASFAASSASFAAFAAFTMRGPTWRTFMRSTRSLA